MRQSLENHGKLDEIRRLSNKKCEESHDVHRGLALAEDYSRPTKLGEYQYVPGIMGISFNPSWMRKQELPKRILKLPSC